MGANGTGAGTMTCFEWANRAGDFLDGALDASGREAAEEHLRSCRACTERSERYRLLHAALSSQPRSLLPLPIRKAPLSATLPRLDVAWLSRGPWQRLPWYARTSIEGAAIVIGVVLGISAIPRVRALYETRLERSLAEFLDGANPLGMGSQPNEEVTARLSRGRNDVADPSDADFSSEGEGDSSDEEESPAVKVGRADIWRFSMRTDSPYEFRTRIVKILTDLKVSPSTPGFGGIEAPGGIQFDLLIDRAIVPNLKRELERAAPRAAEGSDTETFTWYRNPSKKKLPEGKARVVIWLSQM